MLAHAKKIIEYNQGTIAINPRFDKPITSLSTAVEKGEGSLDKEATSYDDILDGLRLALQFYYQNSGTLHQNLCNLLHSFCHILSEVAYSPVS